MIYPTTMPQDDPRGRTGNPLVSGIFDDGILETIYRPQSAQTAFVLASSGHTIEVRDKWEQEGKCFVPVAASNNLLQHHAILMPSDAVDFKDVEALVTDIREYVSAYVALAPRHLDIAA